MDEQKEPTQAAYSVPDAESVDYMDTGEAAKRLRELDSVRQRDAAHPCNRKSDPLYGDFLAYELKLRERAAEGRENPCDRAMREFDAEQEKKQQKRIEAAKKLVDQLVDAGFEPVDIEGDVAEWELRILESQLLCAKRKFRELGSILDGELRKLHAPPGTMAALQTFRLNDDLDAELREKLAEQIIEFVYRGNEQKYQRADKYGGGTKNPKTVEGKDDELL